MEDKRFWKALFMMQKIRLFILPFAGGGKFSFSQLLQHFSNRIDVVPLELPGRGARFGALLLTTMEEIVEDYYLQIREQIDGPYAFWGHSMGSCTSFLLTIRLLKENLPLPIHLFLSGRANVNNAPEDKILHSLPTKQFWEEISGLGGLPEEVFSTPELLELFEPVLRSDLKAVETSKPITHPPIHIPITVLLGKEDHHHAPQIVQWKHMTTIPTVEYWFSGGHFFIYHHSQEIAKLISATLDDEMQQR